MVDGLALRAMLSGTSFWVIVKFAPLPRVPVLAPPLTSVALTVQVVELVAKPDFASAV
jgi:hypothetical protein